MRALRSRITPDKLLWVFAFLVMSPVAGNAAVMDIAPDGTVIIHDGPNTPLPVRAPASPSAAASRSAFPPGLEPAFAQAGTESRLSPYLIAAVAYVESHFQRSAHSPAGANGIMQLMPSTAGELGVDALDANQNIRGGTVYLKRLLQEFGNDLPLALAAYNAGPAAVHRYRGVPPWRETQTYVARVLERLAALSEGLEETE